MQGFLLLNTTSLAPLQLLFKYIQQEDDFLGKHSTLYFL